MNTEINKPEILAPVGSVEAFYSAIHNGCDALYLGGRHFGARAYANNFDKDELRTLVEYAHLYQVAVYYTINTLVKDIEIKTLHKELQLLSDVNIDAVIIQDLGVYEYINEYFGDLVVHASTQMNLHNVEDVEFVKALGFDRVVLSRECSLKDISKIKQATGLEIESFVHGALCYCYSGLCLMSSMYGGRSGNRGKCAQPCRMVYEVDEKAGYFLSPKDQMTLEILPDLIKAGVDSFKIEGRMKSAEYVGFATRIYKKYRDLSLKLIESNREDEYKVNPKDIMKLNQLFNRGHFTDGYYKQHNEQSMISYTHGKNQGWPVGSVEVVKGQFVFNFEQAISKEDLLEIHTDINLKNGETWPSFSFNNDVNKGNSKHTQLYNSSGHKLASKQFTNNKRFKVYRIRDKKLLEELKSFAEIKSRIPLHLKITAFVNKPLQIDVYLKADKKLVFSLTGNTIDQAQKRATGEADFNKQMAKTKDTSYVVEDIDYNIGDNIFIPIGSINELRREMVDRLNAKLLEDYDLVKTARTNTLQDNQSRDKLVSDTVLNNELDRTTSARYTIYVRTLEQVKAVILSLNNQSVETNIQRIYIDITDLEVSVLNQQLTILNKFKNIHVFIALPHVMFEDYKSSYMNKLNSISSDSYAGMLVRSIGEIQLAKQLNKSFVTDYNLHTFNSYGLKALKAFGASGVTLSLELNKQGLLGVINNNPDLAEIVVYGSSALMHSANCIYKTRTGKCQKLSAGHVIDITDRKGIDHHVSCHCQMCYNTIYNKHPLMLLEETKDFNGTFRLDFTSESLEETTRLIKQVVNHTLTFNPDIHTRGHFKKGVK